MFQSPPSSFPYCHGHFGVIPFSVARRVDEDGWCLSHPCQVCWWAGWKSGCSSTQMVYIHIYIYLFNFIYTPKFSCQLRGVFSSVPAQELTRWRNCTCNLLMTAARMSARTCQLRNRWISSGQHPSLEPVFPIAACCNAHTWTRLLLNILLNHGFLPAHCSMWLFQMWMATGRID